MIEEKEKDNMDGLNEERTGQAQTLEWNESGPTESLGKFKDVNALYKAYNSLQAEFTRRSQRLKELENGLQKNNATPKQEVPDLPTDEVASLATENAEPTDASSQREIDEEQKKAIIEEYLKEVKKNTVPTIRGGVSVTGGVKQPSSIQEAGEMALGYLKFGK